MTIFRMGDSPELCKSGESQPSSESGAQESNNKENFNFLNKIFNLPAVRQSHRVL